jgi:hypothetical protein
MGGLDVIFDVAPYFYAVSRFNFLSKIERLLLLIFDFLEDFYIFASFKRPLGVSRHWLSALCRFKSYITSSKSIPISISFSTRLGCHTVIMISCLYIAQRSTQRFLLS